MTSPELERLVAIELLKREEPRQPELDGLYRSAHERRNTAEYEGHLERDDQLLEDLIGATRVLLETLSDPSEVTRGDGA